MTYFIKKVRNEGPSTPIPRPQQPDIEKGLTISIPRPERPQPNLGGSRPKGK